VRVLVCGDREWPESDRDYMYEQLDQFHAEHHIDIIIEGEQRGADIMSREWAKSRGIPHDPYPAAWRQYHKGAGPIRNRKMMREGKPDYVLAFHRNPSVSKGTKDMVSVAQENGVPYKWLPSGATNMTLFAEDEMPKEVVKSSTTGVPGPLTPDRTAVPDPTDATTRDAGLPHLHKHTNTVEGLQDPEAEPKAPGRPTHGANNNG
jgi:hypothetical protein